MNEITVQKILDTAKVDDVLQNYGVQLVRSGKDYTCHSPFRDDRHTGSFKVSPSRNIVSDFASGESWNVKELVAMFEYGKSDDLTVKEHYNDILRILASMYRIYVDEEPTPQTRKFTPRPPLPELRLQMWHSDITKPFKQYNERNPLLRYLRGLPWRDSDRERLEKAIRNYIVGTYPSGMYEGFTIWWYLDHLGYVRSGKLMAYKSDGHRDKERVPNFTWAHSLLAKAGKYNTETHRVEFCLFGQHLLEFYPKSVIRLVESEKTALICSVFNNMNEVLWMATGGLSMMTDEKLLPLLKKGRTIELYPDMDGYEKWASQIERYESLRPYIESGHLRISDKVRQLWTEADGEKADIADIMVRIVTTPQVTEGMKAAATLGDISKAGLIDKLIETLDLI